MILARGARQLVVQEALEMTRVGLVGLVVDTHDEHRSIGGRSRDDDLLGATLQVSIGLLGGGEDTGGLDDVLGTSLGPGDVGGVTLHVELDPLAVDDEVVPSTSMCP